MPFPRVRYANHVGLCRVNDIVNNTESRQENALSIVEKKEGMKNKKKNVKIDRLENIRLNRFKVRLSQVVACHYTHTKKIKTANRETNEIRLPRTLTISPSYVRFPMK